MSISLLMILRVLSMKRCPDGYNELCLLVRGCALPIQYSMENGIGDLSPAETARAFPDHPLFRVIRGKLHPFTDPLQSEAVGPATPVSDFYR